MRRLKTELVAHGCIAGPETELLVFSGNVYEEMSDAVNSQQIDLIAMGTHGRTGTLRLLMGSVAQRVFRHSRVPVLLVGPRVDSNSCDAKIERVLFPTDFTSASRYAFPTETPDSVPAEQDR
jgi:Universal stress protein family